MKKKTRWKVFTNILLLFFFSTVTLIASLNKYWNNIYRNILFKTFFQMCSCVFKLFKKIKDKDTKTCCIGKEHCCTQHTPIFNYTICKKHKRRKKSWNKKQQSQGRFLKKELDWISQKILWVKRTLRRTKKEKINFAV